MSMMGAGRAIDPEAPAAVGSLEAAESFEAFFRQESERVFRALWLVTGNPAEAEEITQDAFLASWERWDRVSAMDNPHRLRVPDGHEPVPQALPPGGPRRAQGRAPEPSIGRLHGGRRSRGRPRHARDPDPHGNGRRS